MTPTEAAIAGDPAPCIRRATLALERAIILWGPHALTRTAFAHEAVGRIRRASAGRCHHDVRVAAGSRLLHSRRSLSRTSELR